MSGAVDVWTEDLTGAQLAMVMESGEDRLDGSGFGVELRGAGAWRTARSLAAKELGWIEGGHPNGSNLPGLYFNNAEGVRLLHEFDDEDGEP